MSRLDEIQLLVESNDLSLATRRMLDFFDDYPVDSSLEQKAIELRAFYNHSKELGTNISEADKSSLENAMLQLIEKLRGFTLTSKENTLGTIVFSGQGLGKQFGRGFRLAPLDIDLKLGELTGLVGENGNGKTTLLRIVAGDLWANEGTLHYPLFNSTDWYHIKHQIAFIPQRIPRWGGTLINNLRFSASIHGLHGNDNLKRVEHVIHRMGLTNFRDLTWGQLSSGYKLRFEIAKTLVWRPKLLVLDEPLGNLDINAKQLLLQDLSYLSKQERHPMSVILSSQQLHEIENSSENVVFLQNGQAKYIGATNLVGAERKENSFEITGSFNRLELIQISKSLGECIIEDAGITYIIHTPIEISPKEFLNAVLQAGYEIDYFRDISKSTRKMFHREV